MDSNQTTIQLKPMYPHSHINLYNAPVVSATMPGLSIAEGINIVSAASNGVSSLEANNLNALATKQSAAAASSQAHLVPVSANGVCLNNIQIQQLQMHQQSFSQNHQLQTQCNLNTNGEHPGSQLIQIHLTAPKISSAFVNGNGGLITPNSSSGQLVARPNNLISDTSSNLSIASSTSTSSEVNQSELNSSTGSKGSSYNNNRDKEMDGSGTKYVNLARAGCSASSSSAISMKLSSSDSSFASSLKSTCYNGKGFKCQICNRDFTQKGNLKTHLMTHSGERPYECQTCGKNFTQKGNLDTHLKIHTETKDHKCQYCDRGFTQRGNLKTHIRSIHTKEKPYACGHCGKSFSQKGNMLTHYRTHDKEARFPCNICGKTFSQKVSLSHQENNLKSK